MESVKKIYGKENNKEKIRKENFEWINFNSKYLQYKYWNSLKFLKFLNRFCEKNSEFFRLANW